MTHADRDASEPATHPCEGCGTWTSEIVCRDCWGTTDDPRWCRDCNGVCKGLATCSPYRATYDPASDATCPPDATETPEGIGAGSEAAEGRTEAQGERRGVAAGSSADLTFRDLVRHVLERELTDDEADFILWEHTPFPLVQGAVDLAPYLARFRAEAAERALADERARWRVSDAALREATERAEAAEAAVARVEAHGETMLRHYSRALDEIYALRQLLAYEARVVEATLEGYKTFPKSRRAAHEGQVERMRTAARGSAVPSVAEFGSAVLRTCMKEAGVPETLTRSQWEGDA